MEEMASVIIKEIGTKEANKIIETREPRGLFVCTTLDKIIGIDNRTGDAWTEEFDSVDDCVKWLQEIPCKGCIDPDREAQEEAEPMHYNYPRVKFVDSNTIYEQLKHVESELQEIKDASPGDQNDAWGEEWEKEVEEIFDLHHSVETCIRTLQEVYGVDIEKYRRAVIEKNRKRGYYGEEE
jgi:hypothetical protein